MLWTGKGCLTPTDLTCSALSSTFAQINGEQSTCSVHIQTFSSLQQTCLSASGLIHSLSRSWQESRLSNQAVLPTAFDPPHNSKCCNCAIPLVCEEYIGVANDEETYRAVFWPSKSMLSMLEPVFKTKTVSYMKCSQNKLIVEEFPNIFSQAGLIFLLKWSFLFHCAQEQLHGKMEETCCTLSPLRSKLQTLKTKPKSCTQRDGRAEDLLPKKHIFH